MQTLVDTDPAGLVPYVLSALQAARQTPSQQQLAMTPQTTEVRDAMRRKEAAYLAVCVLDCLKGSLDVGEWLQGSLLPEMSLVLFLRTTHCVCTFCCIMYALSEALCNHRSIADANLGWHLAGI